jgi:hypothetical protein
MRKKNSAGHIDRSETLDDFLARDGLLVETEDSAIKEIIADQIRIARGTHDLSRTEIAARRKTNWRKPV